MEDWVKYLILVILAVFLVLCLPSIITLIGIFVSPIISTIGFVSIIFIITIILAYSNRDDEKDKRK